MAIDLKYRGSLTVDNSGGGSPITVNLANFPVGSGASEVAANPDGPIVRPTNQNTRRGLEIIIDNKIGSASACLVRPEDLPENQDPVEPFESRNLTAMAAHAGDQVAFTDRDYTTWDLVLRLLPGANVVVTVSFSGAGWV